MFKGLVIFLFGLFAGIFSVTQCSGPAQETWVPALDVSEFIYFEDILNASINEFDSNTAEDRLALEANLIKLKQFYVPLTEVRHLVYDADRFFYLHNIEQALAKLDSAGNRLKKLKKNSENVANDPATDLVLMIEKLIRNINNKSDETNQQFRALGKRINLLLLKGETILSDARF